MKKKVCPLDCCHIIIKNTGRDSNYEEQIVTRDDSYEGRTKFYDR